MNSGGEGGTFVSNQEMRLGRQRGMRAGDGRGAERAVEEVAEGVMCAD